ncbi:hypothetical protein N7532_011851 [Penicillium argentinense]|uniref:Major facilitator superfamily (MFS) profile domain-containing protein n=1 Tax=Penicillium argentinense TaxID=1131581 RepID=A0A9W9EJA4_9EURO|nr:uncharacterized protein N7532_011851 [Penicillium argentinense]KAJ5082808.1 hypothetical protein N7532_011851 [Penicillium argentinense]
MEASIPGKEERDSQSVDPTMNTAEDTIANRGPVTPSSQSEDPEVRSEKPTPVGLQTKFFHEMTFVFVVCAAQLMTQAGLSLSIAPLQVISTSFDTSPKDLTWASASYSMTVGTFIFVSGRLGDVYGHRLLFIIGFMWFGLWSLLGGFAVWSNLRFFICCRALQGIGPALLLPNAVAILGRFYPPGRRKGMMFCLFGAVAPGGFTLGATFSSLLAERVWWPWGYWISGIVCFIFAVLGFFVIPYVAQQKPREDLSTFERLDTYGAITGVSGLILINFAWNQASVVGWKAPYTYVLLIVGILTIVLFLFMECRASYPLLPRSVLVGETGWVLGCVAAGWSSFGVLVFYYYEILENLEGNSGLLVTAKWAGASASGACAAVITGLLLGRIPASVIMFVAMLAFSAGQALLASMPIGQIYWANAFVIMLVTPWGMDMSFPSGILILSNAMPQQDQGVAGSLVNTVVNYSISMGLGFAGVVEHYVSNNGDDILKGYRGATYMGVGLAGFGTLVATCFMIVTWINSRKGFS